MVESFERSEQLPHQDRSGYEACREIILELPVPKITMEVCLKDILDVSSMFGLMGKGEADTSSFFRTARKLYRELKDLPDPMPVSTALNFFQERAGLFGGKIEGSIRGQIGQAIVVIIETWFLEKASEDLKNLVYQDAGAIALAGTYDPSLEDQKYSYVDYLSAQVRDDVFGY